MESLCTEHHFPYISVLCFKQVQGSLPAAQKHAIEKYLEPLYFIASQPLSLMLLLKLSSSVRLCDQLYSEESS
jgi:hypothetical protein